MIIKRVVILCGDIMGAVKLEWNLGICTCSLTLNRLLKSCFCAVKIGNSPSTICAVDKLKMIFKIDANVDIDAPIVCLLFDSEATALAKGKLGRAAEYFNIQTDVERYILKNQSDDTFALNTAATDGLREKFAEAINTAHIPQEQIKQEIPEQTIQSVSGAVDSALLSTADDSKQPFYLKVSARLEELFSLYPHDSQLESLVHSSQWVRVDYDDSNYYVVGLINEDDIPLFICYGVPVENKASSQPENSHCEWLPLSLDDAGGSGYWVLYQDARTGETLT